MLIPTGRTAPGTFLLPQPSRPAACWPADERFRICRIRPDELPAHQAGAPGPGYEQQLRSSYPACDMHAQRRSDGPAVETDGVPAPWNSTWSVLQKQWSIVQSKRIPVSKSSSSCTTLIVSASQTLWQMVGPRSQATVLTTVTIALFVSQRQAESEPGSAK